MRLSPLMSKIRNSATAEFFEKVAKLRADGLTVINLATGEPDSSPPESAIDAAHAALSNGQTHYTLNQGTIELRKAVANHLYKRYEAAFAPDQILISNGAKQSVFNILQATVGANDEVILFSPYYVSYPQQVLMTGATPVIVKTDIENHFQPEKKKLEAAITDRTKLIILNSPNNPTSSVLTKESIQMIGSLAARHDLLILSDEIYESIIYPPYNHFSVFTELSSLRDRIIYVSGISKSFAMTGFRIGYTAAPEEIIKAASIVQTQSTNCPSSISQAAALGAIESAETFPEMLLSELQENRKAVLDIFSSLDCVRFIDPEGAFYLFLDCSALIAMAQQSEIHEADDLADLLLKDEKVAVMSGSSFGDANSLRISFSGNCSELKEGCFRIKERLEKLL